MRKFFPVVLSGLLAVSFSQIAAAQSTTVQGSSSGSVSADVNKPADTSVKSDTSTKAGASTGANTGSAAAGSTTKAGPADNPNVNYDAHGRPHENKGKHKGQVKRKAKDVGQQSSTTKSDKDKAAAGGSSASAAQSDVKPGTKPESTTQQSETRAGTSDSALPADQKKQ